MISQEQTLASIVTADYKTATVLEKYHLDFCCKGKRTLADACIEKGIKIESITAELEQITQQQTSVHLPFDAMTAEQLIGYILTHHHFYVKQAIPQILPRLEKIVFKHGERFPHMLKVLQLFQALQEELLLHLQKEETVLFPRIKELEIARNNNINQPAAGYINHPILQMETEHEHAGSLMEEICTLTNGYTPSAMACTTHRICLEELKQFEADLHKHVHLENYILFPKAKLLIEN